VQRIEFSNRHSGVGVAEPFFSIQFNVLSFAREGVGQEQQSSLAPDEYRRWYNIVSDGDIQLSLEASGRHLQEGRESDGPALGCNRGLDSVKEERDQIPGHMPVKVSVVALVGVVEALQVHRRTQTQHRLAAENWPDEEGHIFMTETGGRVRPEYVTRRLKRLVAEAKLPWIRLHGLRHTMASIALQNGTDIATVSERLGHANTGITARIYLHGSKESDRAAADALDTAFHG